MDKFKLPSLYSVSKNCDSGFGFKSHIGTMFNKTSAWIKNECTRWIGLDIFGQVLTSLGKFGQVWTNYEKFKLPSLHSVSRNCDSGFGFKSHIVHCGAMFNKTSSWIKSDCTRWTGFVCFILDVRFGRFGQTWIMSRYQRQHYLLGKKCKGLYKIGVIHT